MTPTERRAYRKGLREGKRRRLATTPKMCFECGFIHACPGRWPGGKRKGSAAGIEAVPVPTRGRG